MEVKEKVIQKIDYLIKKFDNSDFNIETNIGVIIFIKNVNGKIDLSVDKSNTDGYVLFTNVELCKMSTLYQIVDGLKNELIYKELVEKIKSKKDHWNATRKMWTHQPIDRYKLIEKIKNSGRPIKYVAKRSNNNNDPIIPKDLIF